MLGAWEIILIKTDTIPAHTGERKQEGETNEQKPGTQEFPTGEVGRAGNYNSSIHLVLKLLLNTYCGLVIILDMGMHR